MEASLGGAPVASTSVDQVAPDGGTWEEADLVGDTHPSDAFERRRAEVVIEVADPESDFFLPNLIDGKPPPKSMTSTQLAGSRGARWSELTRQAKRSDIGVLIDAALDLIERENPPLRGVLSKNFAPRKSRREPSVNLIDLFSLVGRCVLATELAASQRTVVAIHA